MHMFYQIRLVNFNNITRGIVFNFYFDVVVLSDCVPMGDAQKSRLYLGQALVHKRLGVLVNRRCALGV